MSHSAARGDDGVIRLQTSAAGLAEQTSVDAKKAEEVLSRLERSRLVIAEGDTYKVPDVVKLAEFLEFLEMRERFGDVSG